MDGLIWMVVKDGVQQEGKYSDADVRAMLAQAPKGSLFVWKEGMSQWADPENLPEFKRQPSAPPQPTAPAQPVVSPPPSASKPEASEKIKEGGKALLGGAAAQLGKIRDAKDSHAYLPHLKILDKCLDITRNLLSRDLLDSFDELGKKVGNVGVLVLAVFYLVGMTIGGIKASSFLSMAGMGAVFFLVFCLAQYVAIKFLDAGKTLIDKSPSRLSSGAVLECIALLAILGAVGALGGGIFAGIQAKSIIPVVGGIGASLVLLYLTGTALNSEIVNVKVAGDATPGEEAIGIYAFLLKLLLRLVPFVYGVSLLVLAVTVAYASISLLFVENFGRAFGTLQGAGLNGLFATLMPFGVYLAVLFLYLSIDVIRSILVIPKKLDQLKDSAD